MASRFSAFFNNEPVEFEINGRFSILQSEKLILNEVLMIKMENSSIVCKENKPAGYGRDILIFVHCLYYLLE
ncbi:hypothetical protein T08_10317 [Trichinella sp. T8]|nr:hypothetical protein T08_10317 [Trichinella sp. T8]